MKKLLTGIAVCALVLTACGKKDGSAEGVPTTHDSLEVALANQDSLLSLMNDITDGMAQIKDLEQILSSTTNLGAESQSKREQIRADMIAIQQTLQERRERIEQLEAKLAASGSSNATLRKSIESLKAQLDQQEQSMAGLRQELAAANIKIQEQGVTIDSLNTRVGDVTSERDAAEQYAGQLTEELNTCYYAVGSKNELDKLGIIKKGGFLKSQKLKASDFTPGSFNKANKTTLTVLDLHSKKAKVLTAQPTDSYELLDQDGHKVLKITNPTKFWSTSNYLVVQID